MLIPEWFGLVKVNDAMAYLEGQPGRDRGARLTGPVQIVGPALSRQARWGGPDHPGRCGSGLGPSGGG